MHPLTSEGWITSAAKALPKCSLQLDQGENNGNCEEGAGQEGRRSGQEGRCTREEGRSGQEGRCTGEEGRSGQEGRCAC